MSSLTFFHIGNFVKGIEVEYLLRNGQKKLVTCFKSDHADQLKKSTLKFKNSEFIQRISGTNSPFAIEYLKIITNRGSVMEIGQDSKEYKSAQFNLEVEENFKPISLFGTVDLQHSSNCPPPPYSHRALAPAAPDAHTSCYRR